MKNFVILVFGIVLGALIMYFFYSPSQGELEIRAPKGLISPDHAKTLDQAYNERYRLISDSIVKREGGDNRSSWYELNQIRDYLNYAEKEAQELGYTMDGVRIYLGAHPNDNGKAGYTTLFFVPTGKPNKATASLFNFSLQPQGGDIPGGAGLDYGTQGYPPKANYPQ